MNRTIFLVAMLATPTLFATGILFPLFHAQCFRNSINFCEEGTTWVYTSKFASKCGCVAPKDIKSTDSQTCDAMSSKDCDANKGEDFYNLYPAEKRSQRIGCGCFTTKDD